MGAISFIEYARATSEALSYAENVEFQKAIDESDIVDFAEFLKEYIANFMFHKENVASAIYDWEDVFRNKSTHQYTGRDALVEKLFG